MCKLLKMVWKVTQTKIYTPYSNSTQAYKKWFCGHLRPRYTHFILLTENIIYALITTISRKNRTTTNCNTSVIKVFNHTVDYSIEQYEDIT